MYQVRSSSSGRPLNFRLCDTRGIEENQNKDTNDINFLLEGNVPQGYQVEFHCFISSLVEPQVHIPQRPRAFKALFIKTAIYLVF